MYYHPQSTQNNIGGIYNIPPSPIGNTSPIGYGGYTNGYYSNSNYNRHNPYFIQQQREIQMAQQRESQRAQSSILKKLHKASATYRGEEVTEEELSMYDPPSPVEDMVRDFTYDEKMEYYKLLEIEQNKKLQQDRVLELEGTTVPFVNTRNNAYLMMCQQAKEEIPNDVGLVEYLDKYAPLKYIEAMKNDEREKQKDLTSVYNKADYGKLLGIHKASPMFGNALNPDASIDDQTIRLPTYISDKAKQERRAKFLESIMKMKGGGME